MILLMAWRNIWRNRLRSLLIMFSVAIGLLAGILVLSLYKGMMNGRVYSVIYHETGHIQLHHPHFMDDRDSGCLIDSSREVLKWLSGKKEINCLSPRIITPAMLVSPSGTAGVLVHGVLPEAENKVSALFQKVRDGRGYFDKSRNEILLGKKLADKLNVQNGSKLVLTFSDTGGNLVSGAYRICGIYRSENSVTDEMNVYVSAGALADMLQIPSSFHEISLLLKEGADLNECLKEYRNRFPSLSVESWKELSPETDLMVVSVDYYSLILIGILLLALAFGILNTMLMAVLERSREIGMMLALGTSRLRIFMLILLETFLLGLTGLPAGLGAGYLISGYFHRNGLDLSGFGEELLSGFGFSPVIYPEFPYDKLPMILWMVFFTALLSSLAPAVRALRLRPVETLKL